MPINSKQKGARFERQLASRFRDYGYNDARRKESTVQLALQTFEQFGMIEIIDGIITIPNWGKHQNLDQLESKKEYMKKYMKTYREKQKALTSKTSCKTNSKTNVSEADKIREEEIRKDKIREEERKKKESECQQIAELYKELCPSFPPLIILSDSIKNDLLKSIEKCSIDDFELLFKKTSESSFLCGENQLKWKASFDWLIKTDNIAKVLNGNFDDVSTFGRNNKYDDSLFADPSKLCDEFKEEPKTAADDENIRARAEALKQQFTGS